ncbi:MAG: ATP-binding protein [Bacillota bacterium]
MPRGIRRRLFLSYVTLAVVTAAIIGAAMAVSLRRQAIAALVERCTVEARLLSHVVADGLGTGMLPDFSRDLDRVFREHGTRVTVMAPGGTVLADTQQDAATMESHGERPEVRDALLAGTGYATRYSTTSRMDMLYVAVRVDDGPRVLGVVRVAVPLSSVGAAMRRLIWTIMACLLPAVLAASALSVQVAGRIARPVEEMTGIARRIAAGDLQARVHGHTADELEVLASTINHMAGSLEAYIDQTTAGRRRLEAMLEAMSSGVLFLDPSGQVILANFAAGSFLGLGSRGLTGKGYLEVMRDLEVISLVDQAMESSQVVRREVQLALPRPRHVDVTVTPLPGGPGAGYLVLMYDTTELRRLEQLRSEFVANVSHELRTPITAVQGFAETLLNMDAPVGEVREFAGIIYQESSRLSRLIEDLLELSRLESGAWRPVLEPLDLASLARGVCQRLLHQAAEAGITLVPPAQDGPAEVWGDVHQLEQAVRNLVDNAIKYGRPGGRVELSAGSSENHAWVQVADDGPGIPGSDLPRIFERFYRVDRSRSSRQPGTGLGLAIVKHIAQAHGGRVTVESRPGHTVFCLVLPNHLPPSS